MLSLQRGAGEEGGAGELQLLSTMLSLEIILWKGVSTRKRIRGWQCGDVREKLCQAHLSAGAATVPAYRGERGFRVGTILCDILISKQGRCGLDEAAVGWLENCLHS